MAEDVGLHELAGAAGLSAVYFARQFKRATGMAPHQYLLQQRVERAKMLLGSGEAPLVEVALTCGFSSQSHFGTHFRRVTGTTPAAYRAALRA